jgi:hypothetical protein
MPSLDEDAVKKLAVIFGSDTTQWRAAVEKSQEFVRMANMLSV